jgi:hypothetical protein
MMSASVVKLGRVLVVGVALGCCLGLGRDARATLGGDVASVEANQQRLGASRQIAKLASGERHDLALPSGTRVREYVSPSGFVYAIDWRGPRVPDLRELLGSSFAQLERADTRKEGLHRMTLTGSDLEVRSSGHRGWFAGRAWVPSLVPPGVHPETSLDGQDAR